MKLPNRVEVGLRNLQTRQITVDQRFRCIEVPVLAPSERPLGVGLK